MEDDIAHKLLTTLQSLSDRMARVETQLSEVVRLEEKVSNHAQVLSRFGVKLDQHEQRIHGAELWQASYGNRDYLDQEVSQVREEVKNISKKLQGMESSRSLSRGQKTIIMSIAKWAAGIGAAIIIFALTEKEADACPLTYPHLEQDFQSSATTQSIQIR